MVHRSEQNNKIVIVRQEVWDREEKEVILFFFSVLFSAKNNFYTCKIRKKRI